jgi:DNA-binding MarR family transcriptional regulator
MGQLAARVKPSEGVLGRPTSHLRTLVRISLFGKISLKTLAKYSELPPSNLCTMLKQLERDGLVLDQRDNRDRRIVWYSLTPEGKKIAKKAMDIFRGAIAEMFVDLNKKDEVRLTGALKALNEILSEAKESNQQGDEK